MLEKLILLLRRHRTIPQDDADFIMQHFSIRKVKEGEILLKEGSIAREMFFICNGILKIFVINDKGEEVSYFFLKEDQFCTILDSYENNTVSHEGIKAACDAELIVLPRKALLEVYKHLPYLKELIGQITQAALLEKIAIRNGYLGLDATARYKMFVERQAEIALRVSLQDIASYLGVTPQSLSRIRRGVS